MQISEKNIHLVYGNTIGKYFISKIHDCLLDGNLYRDTAEQRFATSSLVAVAKNLNLLDQKAKSDSINAVTNFIARVQCGWHFGLRFKAEAYVLILSLVILCIFFPIKTETILKSFLLTAIVSGASATFINSASRIFLYLTKNNP